MAWRVAVLITAALTAFVLVVAGALAMRLGASPDGSEQRATAGKTQAAVPLSVVLQREQRYRERLEEANVRLNWAYAQIRTLQGRLAELSARVPGYKQGSQEASTMDAGRRWREEGWEDEERHEREGWNDDEAGN